MNKPVVTKNTVLMKKIIRHMLSRGRGKEVHGGCLLSGEPGVGKTSFINFFSTLLGLEIVLIEVPHMVEEHIINIPFIVINSQTHTTKKGNTQFEMEGGGKYKVVLGESNLFAQIKNPRMVSDKQYLENIYKSPKTLIDTFEWFGGNKTTIPAKFQKVRENYKVIMFLDEYFREAQGNVRNMLRGLLDDVIGTHKVPTHVYTIFASNMKDDGLDTITRNTHMTKMFEMANPEKEEWFDWLLAKFENDQHVKLNMDIINHFRKILKTEHLSHVESTQSGGIAQDVRTSPRRWEHQCWVAM